MSLVEKSLVQADSDDIEVTRYRLLETLRQYGWRAAGRAGRTCSGSQPPPRLCSGAHGATRAAAGWTGQAVACSQLEREHDNLRAALGWSLGVGAGNNAHDPTTPASSDPERGARLAGAAWRFWALVAIWRKDAVGWSRPLPRHHLITVRLLSRPRPGCVSALPTSPRSRVIPAGR